MSTSGYKVARIGELEPARGAESSDWLRLRRDLGVAAFGINAYRAKAGGRVIEEHDETGSGAGRHEEAYRVSPWEEAADAWPLYEAGRVDEAKVHSDPRFPELS